MSNSRGHGHDGRGHVQQDYIARIRYSNALPPPPNPPKLLDMPSTGLLESQYVTPAFASRLAREQTLNIEADSELGMALDLVGMPGVFDGDDSCTCLVSCHYISRTLRAVSLALHLQPPPHKLYT